MSINTINQSNTTALQDYNTHLRDNSIQFIEENHKYIVNGDDSFVSVTTWIHSMFSKFNPTLIIKNMMKGKNWNENNKYWSMTEEEIKKQWSDNGKIASSLGTTLHNTIEYFSNSNVLFKGYNNEDILQNYNLFKVYTALYNWDLNPIYYSKEWEYFLNFINDCKYLKPYRTEWVVYDSELKIAGSIDMIYQNEDDSYSIYDWKRSKGIEKVNNWNKKCLNKEVNIIDSNYWHYSLQLNTYKFILEKNYDIKIKDMYLVRLHPDADNYELIEVNDMQKEVEILLKNRLEK